MKGEILQFLTKKYNKATLTKKEVATELGLSLRTIDNLIKDGRNLPQPFKVGAGKKSSVRFNIIDIAEFIANAIGYKRIAIEGRFMEEQK